MSLAPGVVRARIETGKDLLPHRPPKTRLKKGKKLSNVKLTLALILAGLIVLFTLQNADIVELRFLFWRVSMPRALMIFSVLTAGVVIGWLLSELTRPKNG